MDPAEPTVDDTLASVTLVLRSEGEAVLRLAEIAATQGEALHRACAVIRAGCGDGQPGRLVVTGVGKAGIIARKLAATFASTGTPAIWLHPAEARHGDLGMVQVSDVVLALSNSGASEEVLAILPALKHIGCPLIALVGRTDSPLARHADVLLTIGRVSEACPLGLAPSTSTTAMLALGDALALTVQRHRRFSPEQYARYHPGGALGRRLMTCGEAMRSDGRVPAVAPDTPLIACLRAITDARAGCAVVVDGGHHLLGIFTDGDLRRALMRSPDVQGVLHAPVRDHASMPCRHVRAGELLQHALHLCAERKINTLPVVDEGNRLVGLLDVQDLVDRGFDVQLPGA